MHMSVFDTKQAKEIMEEEPTRRIGVLEQEAIQIFWNNTINCNLKS